MSSVHLDDVLVVLRFLGPKDELRRRAQSLLEHGDHGSLDIGAEVLAGEQRPLMALLLVSR
jgi:hypothetical protein